MWCTAIFVLGALLEFWVALSKDSGPTEQQIKEIQDFEIAEKRWRKSYYCYRCDCVFLTHNNSKWYNDASSFYNLLYGNLE